MILLGCLLAFGMSVAPRLFLVLAWIFSDRWPKVWGGDFLLPLLGIILLPYTTIMYMLVWSPTGISGWDWLWILLGLFLDFTKWSQVIANRKAGMETAQKYYPEGAPGSSMMGSGGSGGSASSGSSSSATKSTFAGKSTSAGSSTSAGGTSKPTDPPPGDSPMSSG